MFSVSALHSAVDSGVIMGALQWQKKFWQLKTEHSTDCVGTLKLNRKSIPKEVKDKKLEKGEIIARHSGPVTVLKWRDKRIVTMVSTYHNADTQRVSNKGKESLCGTSPCVVNIN